MDRTIGNKYDPTTAERKIYELWEKKNTYERVKDSRMKGKEIYFLDSLHSLYDMNSPEIVYSMLVKDAIIRYLRMRGYNVKDKPGFEGYVPEAESRAMEDLELESEEDIGRIGREKYLNACRKEAREIRGEIAEFFKKFGVWMDWKHPYTPLDNRYVEAVWYAFKALSEKGLVDRFRGIGQWCPHCKSFLSASEIKTETEWKRGIYVKFPLKGRKKEYLVVWFSEPWRLTATVALEVLPSKKYSVIELKTKGEKIIIGSDEAKKVLEDSGITKYEVAGEISGKEILEMRYTHPLFGMEQEEGVISAEEIESEELKIDRILPGRSGGVTGMKAVVPAHSVPDMSLAERNSVPVITPVDEAGELGEDTGKYAGFDIFEAESIIVRDLVNTGMALSTYDIRESVRFCSRCNNRLIPRISEEWSFKPSETGERSEELASDIEWFPAWMMGADYDWMGETVPVPISRKGYWGVPMPVWICSCGHREIAGSAKELAEKSKEFKAGMGLQRPWIDKYTIKCPECGKDMKRVEEILSPEFVDSAASWGQLHYPSTDAEFKRWWPANLISEPLKRSKGWIYLQLSISGAVFEKKPFERVLGTGKLNMSSVEAKNILELRNRYGTDVLRYSLLRSDAPWISRTVRKEWFERSKSFVNTLWNVHRFASIYYRLSGFKPEEAALEIIHEYGLPQDKWLISIIEGVKEKYMQHMDNLMLNEAIKEVEILTEIISRWYIRAVRTRIKSENLEKREVMAGYRALHEGIITALKLLAPFAPYISEIMYKNIGGTEESIHKEIIEVPNKLMVDRYLEIRMDIAEDIIKSGRRARKKAGIGLRWPVNRIVVKAHSPEVVEAKELFEDFIKEELNVRTVEVVSPAEEWKEMILEVHPNPDAIGLVYRQWSSRIAVMLKNRPAKKIREGIDKGEYYLGIEGQLVKILPNMVQFVSKLPEYVIESEFLDGKVYLDIRRGEELAVEGRMREIVRMVQDMRKDMDLNFGDYINLYISGNEDIENAVETWGEEIAESTKAQEITLTNEEGMEGEYIVEWYIEGEKVVVGITPLYWEEMVSAFSRIPGISKQRAETLFDAGYINMDMLRGAKEDELTQISGITAAHAKKILSYLKTNFSEGALLIRLEDGYQCSACGAIMNEPEEICPKCHLPLYVKKTKEAEEKEIEERVPSEEETEEEFIDTVAKIKGIGPSKARALYKAGYHTINDLRNAALKDLSSVPKMSEALAEIIKEQFGGLPEKVPEKESAEKGEKEEEAVEMSEEEFIREISKIKGIGPSKARALYKAGYHTTEALRNASPEELAKVKRFSRALAETIKEAYPSETSKKEAKKPKKEVPVKTAEKIEWRPGRLFLFRDSKAMYEYAKKEEESKKIMYLTKESPKSLKSTYGLSAGDAFQISNIAKKALRPNELDRIALKIQKFTSKKGEKIVVSDSFDQVVSNNSFESVMNFLDALKEDFASKNCMLVLAINLDVLTEKERKQIEDKADMVL